MGKQQIRPRKEASPVKKVSDVEAAYVVQSYLIEKQFTQALAGFHVEAASILSSLKNTPPAVRSLTTILNDFVSLREKQQTLNAENARLEQRLKEAQQVLLQERSRMSSFVQGVHESLAVFQSGCSSPNTLALPSMSSSPTNSAAVFQVGLNTPSEAGTDLMKTPCSVRATNSGSASNKRKNGLNKTSQEAPNNESPTTRVVSIKKARPSVSGPLARGPPPSPWMCGMVRKNSLNMVRPVLPIPSDVHVPTSGSKNPQASRSGLSSGKSTRLTSPPAGSTELPATSIPSQSGDQQNIGSSALPTTCTEPLKEACLDGGQSFSQDPQTPPRNSSVVIPPEQVSFLSQSLGNIVHLQPSSKSPLDTKSCTPHSARGQSSLGENMTVQETALHSDSSSESAPESCHSDRTRKAFNFKLPSKTMRPLDFSDSALNSPVESPASQVSFHTMSPAPSECLDTSVGAQAGDTPEHSTADLFLIDDILASLDDASFSSLVGDMLGTEEITMNGLVSNPEAYGDVDFSSIQSVTNRCSIDEDSFGFQCLTEEANCGNTPSPTVDGVLELDGRAKSVVPLKIVGGPECLPLQPVGILSERDPNRTYPGNSPRKCSSTLRHTPKRETKAKYASGQENTPTPDFEIMVEGAHDLSRSS